MQDTLLSCIILFSYHELSNLKNKKIAETLILLVFQRFFLLPAAGLEPARGCPQQILSLPRLPFRHAGLLFKDVTGHSAWFHPATKIIIPYLQTLGKQENSLT